VHAASCNESFLPDYARKALRVNAYGTRNLLEALAIRAETDKTPPPLIVYCSTFHVYGKDAGRIDESNPPAPRNDYALTHYFGEEYCRFFGRIRGLPHIIVRCTNGYGAPVRAPFDKWYLLLNDLCRNALRKGNVVLRSNPSIRRDFIWMGDVALALESLLARPDLSGCLFNISRGVSMTLGEAALLVARAASNVTGREIPLALETRPSPTPELLACNEALRRATGFAPHDNMEEELRAALAFLALHGEE
jgi:UDP-glucose 4-epimerase